MLQSLHCSLDLVSFEPRSLQVGREYPILPFFRQSYPALFSIGIQGPCMSWQQRGVFLAYRLQLVVLLRK